MTNEEFMQGMVDAVNRLARAIENFGSAPKTAVTDAARKSAATKKKGDHIYRGPVHKRLKDWPNDHGWFKARLGESNDAWFATKSKSIAAILEEAHETDTAVFVTYNVTTSPDGKYTNRYIESAEIGEGPSDAELAAAAASEEPKPEAKPRTNRKQREQAPPADEVDEAPF